MGRVGRRQRESSREGKRGEERGREGERGGERGREGNKRSYSLGHNTTNIPLHIPWYEYTGVTLLTDIQSQRSMQLDGTSCLKEKNNHYRYIIPYWD